MSKADLEEAFIRAYNALRRAEAAEYRSRQETFRLERATRHANERLTELREALLGHNRHADDRERNHLFRLIEEAKKREPH